ncbi:aquaporin-like protein [Pluteus cervinus]|uniref:Aquaporin-like protein n=1 Tax=Pluteus cervinus TaxID=181527 RepID=A0ACD3B5D2_9AGAR|nr:aquaporin-like protein [Pluteus cervinus]
MATPIVHLGDFQPRSVPFATWEKFRNRKNVHLLSECFAEALGVFFYVYAGVGSGAGWVLGNILGEPLSSILQIGFAYALGILLSLSVCAGTSGGHINPCVTISLTIFRKFPRRKVIPYIVSQIFGAYVACGLIYIQWKELIVSAENTLTAAGTLESTLFSPTGPAGVFAFYLPAGQTFARVFVNEWVVCMFIAWVIWASMDPANLMITPAMGPVVVSLSYSAAIWGFATTGIALNTARDLGGRLFVMSVYGVGASGGRYAAIAALTNIPATIFAVLLYELFLTDSDRVIPRANFEFASVLRNHRRFGHAHIREDDDATRQVVVDGVGELHKSMSSRVRDESSSGKEDIYARV